MLEGSKIPDSLTLDLWLSLSVKGVRPLPRQYNCTGCTCRNFYLMLQDDGSIEAFCTQNNHRQVMINIPELVSHILHVEERKAANAETTAPGTETASRDQA